MSQLSEEQQERVKRIREQRHAATLPANQRGLLHTASWVDIDFLLSLLDSDSQAAGDDAISRNEVVARIERQIRLWNDNTVTMACADMLADIKQLPSIDAATTMRDKCVAELDQQRNRMLNLYQQIFTMKSTGDPQHPLQACIDYDAKAAFEEALESLTLDQVKPGEM